jgi:ribosomal protein S18 acetylase RimI-like enzyme
MTETSFAKQSAPSVSLRQVTPADEEFLVAVYGETRAQELSQVMWDEGQKESFVRWQFEMQRREYDARFPNARYDIILLGDVPVGRIWVGIDEAQIRLLDIAVLSEFQNRGIGTELLRSLMHEATQENKPLRHTVFVLNTDAYRFYQRLGFETIEDLGAYKQMEWRPQLRRS